jgi:hypothetical protein
MEHKRFHSFSIYYKMYVQTLKLFCNNLRIVEKACHTSDFFLTGYLPETTNLALSQYKQGHNSG